MKISSSSSLIFATLAVSSSSTCLAAPTGDSSQANGELSSSPSARHIASRRASIVMPRAEVGPEGDQVANTEGLLDGLLDPVCNLSLGKIIEILPIVNSIAPALQPVDGLLHSVVGVLCPPKKDATSATAASAPQNAAAWSVDGDSSSAVSPSGQPNTPAMTSDPSSSDPSPPSRRDLLVTPPSNTSAGKSPQPPVPPPVSSPNSPINSPSAHPPITPPNPPINPPSNPQAPFTSPTNPPIGGAEAPAKVKPTVPVNPVHEPPSNTSAHDGAPSPPVPPPSLPPAPVQKNRRGVPLNPAKNSKRAAEKVGGPTSGDRGTGKGPSDDSSSPGDTRLQAGPNRRSRRQVSKPPISPPAPTVLPVQSAVKPPVQPPVGSPPTSSATATNSVSQDVTETATTSSASMAEAAASTDPPTPSDDEAGSDDDSGEDGDRDGEYDSSSDGSSA